MNKIFKKNGFTLVELLVVIAIIGILSSIVLVSLSSARGKARNATRLSDIKQYITTFEMAYDQNGEYPDIGDTNWRCLGNYSDNLCWGNGTSVAESATLNAILDDWFSALPAGDLVCSGSTCYEGYLYRCVTRTGGICTSLDVRWFMEGNNQSCGPGSVISTNVNWTYCIYQN
ncbi:MAG: type II secretion system protein [bacterium]